MGTMPLHPVCMASYTCMYFHLACIVLNRHCKSFIEESTSNHINILFNRQYTNISFNEQYLFLLGMYQYTVGIGV